MTGLDPPRHIGVIGSVIDYDHRDYFGPANLSPSPSPHSPPTWMIPSPQMNDEIYLRPEYSDGLVVIPSRHYATDELREVD